MSSISSVIRSININTTSAQLVKFSETFNYTLDQTDEEGNHALLATIQRGNFSLAEYIITQGGKNLITFHEKFNFSPLDYAISNYIDQGRILKFFIKHLGDDINTPFSVTVIRNNRKIDVLMTPLHYAIYEENTIAIRVLLAYGGKLLQAEENRSSFKSLNQINSIRHDLEKEKQPIEQSLNEVLTPEFPSQAKSVIMSYIPPPSMDELTPNSGE